MNLTNEKIQDYEKRIKEHHDIIRDLHEMKFEEFRKMVYSLGFTDGCRVEVISYGYGKHQTSFGYFVGFEGKYGNPRMIIHKETLSGKMHKSRQFYACEVDEVNIIKQKEVV